MHTSKLEERRHRRMRSDRDIDEIRGLQEIAPDSIHYRENAAHLTPLNRHKKASSYTTSSPAAAQENLFTRRTQENTTDPSNSSSAQAAAHFPSEASSYPSALSPSGPRSAYPSFGAPSSMEGYADPVVIANVVVSPPPSTGPTSPRFSLQTASPRYSRRETAPNNNSRSPFGNRDATTNPSTAAQSSDKRISRLALASNPIPSKVSPRREADSTSGTGVGVGRRKELSRGNLSGYPSAMQVMDPAASLSPSMPAVDGAAGGGIYYSGTRYSPRGYGGADNAIPTIVVEEGDAEADDWGTDDVAAVAADTGVPSMVHAYSRARTVPATRHTLDAGVKKRLDLNGSATDSDEEEMVSQLDSVLDSSPITKQKTPQQRAPAQSRSVFHTPPHAHSGPRGSPQSPSSTPGVISPAQPPAPLDASLPSRLTTDSPPSSYTPGATATTAASTVSLSQVTKAGVSYHHQDQHGGRGFPVAGAFPTAKASTQAAVPPVAPRSSASGPSSSASGYDTAEFESAQSAFSDTPAQRHPPHQSHFLPGISGPSAPSASPAPDITSPTLPALSTNGTVSTEPVISTTASSTTTSGRVSKRGQAPPPVPVYPETVPSANAVTTTSMEPHVVSDSGVDMATLKPQVYSYAMPTTTSTVKAAPLATDNSARSFASLNSYSPNSASVMGEALPLSTTRASPVPKAHLGPAAAWESSRSTARLPIVSLADPNEPAETSLPATSVGMHPNLILASFSDGLIAPQSQSDGVLPPTSASQVIWAASLTPTNNVPPNKTAAAAATSAVTFATTSPANEDDAQGIGASDSLPGKVPQEVLLDQARQDVAKGSITATGVHVDSASVVSNAEDGPIVPPTYAIGSPLDVALHSRVRRRNRLHGIQTGVNFVRSRKEKEKKQIERSQQRLTTQSQLSYGMMLGIYTSVVNSAQVKEQSRGKLSIFDFMNVRKLEFPPYGSPQTPPHALPRTFKFKDYAPVVFHQLRERFNVDQVSYLRSLGGAYEFIEFNSNSKSGSFFFYSHDGRFMIKTQSKAESKFLRRMLAHYYSHVMSQPRTYMTRFYGMHRIKMPHMHRKIHFVVMESVFYGDTDIHRKYDLKGSLQGRAATEKDLARGPDQCVFKDRDILRFGERIKLGTERKAAFMAQLEADSRFLQRMGIMDYSLLLGIHRGIEGRYPEVTTVTTDIPPLEAVLTPSRSYSSSNKPSNETQNRNSNHLNVPGSRSSGSFYNVNNEYLANLPNASNKQVAGAYSLANGKSVPPSAGANSSRLLQSTNPRFHSTTARSRQVPMLGAAMLAAASGGRDRPPIPPPLALPGAPSMRAIKSPRLRSASNYDSTASGVTPFQLTRARSSTFSGVTLGLSHESSAKSLHNSDSPNESFSFDMNDDEAYERWCITNNQPLVRFFPKILPVVDHGKILPPVPSDYPYAGGGIPGADDDGDPTGDVYFVGIIDILQQFNARKIGEFALKSIIFPANEISAVSPTAYADRFLEFVDGITD